MPDGSFHRRDLQKNKSRGHRIGGSVITGKQSQADLVSSMTSKARMKQNEPGMIGPDHQAELAELRALEAVGVRRRRRW